MRRELLIPVLATLLLVAGVLLTGEPQRGPSIGSHDATGLLGAYAYLDDRGVAVRAGGLDDVGLDELLVIAFPTLTPWTDDEAARLRDRVFAGQRVVLLARDGEGVDAGVLAQLDLERVRLHERFPPDDWEAWWDRELVLEGVTGTETLLVRRPKRHLSASRGEPIWLTPGGHAAAFRHALGRGEVLVYGAGNPFANGWLGGNLDELERTFAGEAVVFDEAHHRLAEQATAEHALTVPLARFGWHVLVLYLVGVWALAWRFGPPRRRREVLAGSVARDLRSLGALARAGGLSSQAAARLLELARRSLDPADHKRLPTRVQADDEAQLVKLGQHVARLQRHGGRR